MVCLWTEVYRLPADWSVVNYRQGFTHLFTLFLVTDKVNFSIFRQLLSQNMFILRTFKCLLK